MTITENLRIVANLVQTAASHIPVRLVAVSKTKPAEAILECYSAGHRHFGENYIQELAEKAASLPLDIQWHFIGNMQSNKAKVLAAIPNLFMIESIDSRKKALSLEKACSSRTDPIGIMLQVNTSGEASKGGIEIEDCVAVAQEIMSSCPKLSLKGLMTIGSPENSAKVPNPDFERLAHCKHLVEAALGIPLELSMGMSGDFEAAIAQGSTNVRVGSKIFGERFYQPTQ